MAQLVIVDDDRRIGIKPIGNTGLKTASGLIFEECEQELRFPQSARLYKKMARDPAIAAPLNLFDVAIGQTDSWFEAKEGASEEAKRATEFLNYNRNNMRDLPWKDCIDEFGAVRTYGFHVSEISFEKVKTGKWKGKYKWKELGTRSQDTLTRWEFHSTNLDLTGVWQREVTTDGAGRLSVKSATGELFLPRKKFLLFRTKARRGNPEGESLLKAAYYPWRSKLAVEDYQIIGVAKDMGGTAKVEMPADYLTAFYENPSTGLGRIAAEMLQQGKGLHAGEEALIAVPSDCHETTGKRLFESSLMGIDGGGKQYDTGAIIQQKSNEIFTLFMADVLKLGQDGSGSFALSEFKGNLLDLAIKQSLDTIASPINEHLVKLSLRKNGFNVDAMEEAEELPKLVWGETAKLDIEEISKAIQRMVSVGAMTVDKALDEFCREKLGVRLNTYDKANEIPDAFKADTGSKAGEGLKTSGEGTSKKPSGGDKNAGNKDT